MLRRYRLFLFKLITTPTSEDFSSKVLTAFLSLVLLQGVNLASLLNLIRVFLPSVYQGTNKVVIVCLLFFPPALLNYFFIYYQKGYQQLLADFSSEKKGTLKTLALYGLISVGVLFVSVRIMRVVGRG